MWLSFTFLQGYHLYWIIPHPAPAPGQLLHFNLITSIKILSLEGFPGGSVGKSLAVDAKDSVFKTSHILRYWGLVLEHLNLKGKYNSIYNIN